MNGGCHALMNWLWCLRALDTLNTPHHASPTLTHFHQLSMTLANPHRPSTTRNHHQQTSTTIYSPYFPAFPQNPCSEIRGKNIMRTWIPSGDSACSSCRATRTTGIMPFKPMCKSIRTLPKGWSLRWINWQQSCVDLPDKGTKRSWERR